MAQARPVANTLYIERPRLLRALPDAPGFVVWLEAPYGYGKTVLASHWASELEADGWRIVWQSALDGDIRAQLNNTLDLPPDAPWGLLLDVLWNEPTLVVLEDLTGEEDLRPLLTGNRGLVLLASRGTLHYPALPKLLTAGKLHHVTGDTLAFTESEAQGLFQTTDAARHAWEETQGWPLPLHFTAITGALPERTSLLEGIRASVTPEAWQELLFLASINLLPVDAATEHTEALRDTGIAQPLAVGYRLHPLVADGIVAQWPEEVRDAVRTFRHRLSAIDRGHAFTRAKDAASLHDLLSDLQDRVATRDPALFLTWDEATPGEDTPGRLANRAVALFLLEQFPAAISIATRLLQTDALEPADAADLCGYALFALGRAGREAEGLPFVDEAERLLPRLNTTSASGLLVDWGTFYSATGDYHRGEEYYLRALERIRSDPDAPGFALRESRVLANISVLRWELHGDSLGAARLTRSLIKNPVVSNRDRGVLLQNYAMLLIHTGDVQEAIEALEEAYEAAPKYGFARVAIAAQLAYFKRNVNAFPQLLADARHWESRELPDRVSALWLATLRREEAPLSEIDAILPHLAGGRYTDLERCWYYARTGELDEANRILDELEEVHIDREFLTEWLAAAYIIRNDDAYLRKLLTTTSAAEAILPVVGIPLELLPADEPKLLRFYPIRDVLEYGNEAAIAYRLQEVPPLELELLGTVTVRLLGEEVSLSMRLQELIVLLALGESRDVIGEAMWPEIDIAKQRNSLGVYFNSLRKVIEPWRVPTYIVDSHLVNFTSDVQQVHEALEADDPEALLSAYTAPLASNLEPERIREARDDLHTRVQQRFIAYSEWDIPSDLKLRLYQRLLDLEPLNEEALQRYVTLLLTLGRYREAEKHVSVFTHMLASEYGLTPHPNTLALIQTPRS